ncbi:hypothetical protein WH47_00177 [Habropoda laboriosa]|uniref:Uncharacterized protein n=1 Tax=Habropoda laboriosa TaxID=597456 RepID=A0A0L7R1F3_9HYME|nr:hypothetical protein WH47_00177 [Habropoda laboriosa]
MICEPSAHNLREKAVRDDERSANLFSSLLFVFLHKASRRRHRDGNTEEQRENGGNWSNIVPQGRLWLVKKLERKRERGVELFVWVRWWLH